MAIETRDQLGIIAVERPASGTHMARRAFRHDLIIILLLRAVRMVDRVTANAIDLVLAALGLDRLKIGEMALTTFRRGQGLHHGIVWRGRR
jgi:hypothetical protein